MHAIIFGTRLVRNLQKKASERRLKAEAAGEQPRPECRALLRVVLVPLKLLNAYFFCCMMQGFVSIGSFVFQHPERLDLYSGFFR